jgi:hypothetical protein
VHEILIYNHDIRRCQAQGWNGWELYSGRALGISRPPDIVQMHPKTKKLWPAVTSHYRNIGLTHSSNPVWDTSFKIFGEFPRANPSFFIFTDAVNRKSEEGKWLKEHDPAREDVVSHINSKNNFIALSRKMGLRTPETITFNNQKKPALDSPGFPCFLKRSIAVSGFGITRCENWEELEQAFLNMPGNIPFQVQKLINAEYFLNLQYEKKDGKIHRFAATEQVLNGNTHSGSRFPVPAPPWELLDPLAAWLAEKGIKEIIAFDLAVAGTRLKPEYFTLECNPRFNGSTYPALIARKLGIQSWSCETFSTGYRQLHEIDFSGIEYDSSTGDGIILVNWGTVLAGYLGILLAGTAGQQARIKNELLKRL